MILVKSIVDLLTCFDNRMDHHNYVFVATLISFFFFLQIPKLQASNCEVLVVVYNQRSGSLYTTGTPNGLEFLNSQNPGIHWQFAGAMSNSSCEYNFN